MDLKTIKNKEIFYPEEKIDYAIEGVVSKEILAQAEGGITLFAFDKGQRLSEHSAPFDAIIQ